MKKKLLIIIIAILSAALITGGIILLVNRKKWFGSPPPIPTETGIAGDPNAEPLEPSTGDGEGEGVLGPNEIKIPGWQTISISKNLQDVKMALENPAENPCYFVYEIILTHDPDTTEDDEVIFKSGRIDPGYVVKNVHLTRPIEGGVHYAQIKITPYALDDGRQLNGATGSVIIHAQ